MDEQELPDSHLAAIFLEASFLHEQALAACLEEIGDELDLSHPRSRELAERALLHAERAAACAGDAANTASSPEAQAVAKRSLVIGRLAVLALRGLLADPRLL
jgi:hypothetical protein